MILYNIRAGIGNITVLNILMINDDSDERDRRSKGSYEKRTRLSNIIGDRHFKMFMKFIHHSKTNVASILQDIHFSVAIRVLLEAIHYQRSGEIYLKDCNPCDGSSIL